MADGLNMLTFDWFLPRALVGVLTGYVLRVVEHVAWARTARQGENPSGNLGFAIMILPQSAVFGFTLGYVVLVVISLKVSNETVLGISAYLIAAFLAFIATDLRDLLRRISRW